MYTVDRQSQADKIARESKQSDKDVPHAMDERAADPG